MEAIDRGARRFIWCRGQAAWLLGPPAGQWLEDLRGAVAAGQRGLARHVSRQLAEDCAVMLALTLCYRRPVPEANMRGAWALEQVADHPVGRECWELIRAPQELVADEALVERCAELQRRASEVVGTVPNALTPEGYFPAMGLAREWLALVNAVGEEKGFLPDEWSRGSDANG
ncbi:MAG TPA: hypothetical protein VFX45_00495 [Solirubrobacterales bacterium]|nr:hypothetical protein [Solirubrobacterales bacterium]